MFLLQQRIDTHTQAIMNATKLLTPYAAQIVLSQEMKVKDMTNIVIKFHVANDEFIVKTANGDYNVKRDTSLYLRSSFVTTGLMCRHMICVASHA